jgi:hypothetical protein
MLNSVLRFFKNREESGKSAVMPGAVCKEGIMEGLGDDYYRIADGFESLCVEFCGSEWRLCGK